jgi:hypothetical protein
MSQSDFEKITKESRESSFLKELWMMLRDKKKFWLMPIVVVLLLFAILVFLSGTAVAPFIYTLF